MDYEESTSFMINHAVLILLSVSHATLQEQVLICIPHYNDLHTLIELNGPGF